MGLTCLSLFSGIGGLDLAAEAAGFETVGFCEREPFAVEILRRRWPDVPIHDDVRTLDGGRYRGVCLVHGGFPCQDLSSAGKKEGLKGSRSGLWFEMLRAVREARPRWVLVENVRRTVHVALDEICSGLEDAGYQTWPFVLPAYPFGGLQVRERLFVVAAARSVTHSVRMRKLEPPGIVQDQRGRAVHGYRWAREPEVSRVAHGLPRRMVRALGNAVVPAQAYPLLAGIASIEAALEEVA